MSLLKSVLWVSSFILLLSALNCEMLSENVVLAINCGGDTFTDQRGITYEKDNYYSGGQESDFGTNFEIKLTDDNELYQTERWAGEDLHYDLPINQSGKYVLVLKFSEVYFNSPGEKIFDVSIGKETVVKNLDIFSKVSKSTAYDEFIEFEFKNGRILINGKYSEGAYNEETGTFRLTFKKGERDNPKINAIALVKGTLANTDYEKFKKKIEDLEKQKSEKERKQREFQKKSNDHEYEDFEDDFVDSDYGSAEGASLLSPFNIVLSGVAFYAMYLLFVKPKKEKDEDDDE